MYRNDAIEQTNSLALEVYPFVKSCASAFLLCRKIVKTAHYNRILPKGDAAEC